MRRQLALTLWVVAVGCGAGVAAAQVSLVEIAGVFETSQSLDEPGLNTFAPLEGQAFSLVFAYDPSSPDLANATTNVGEYEFTAPPGQFVLTSGAVTLSDTLYSIRAAGPPTATPDYEIYGLNDVASSSGLTLPGGLQYLNIYLEHENPGGGVLDYLDNGSSIDPLPVTPFFLSATPGGIYFEVYLGHFDSQANTNFYQEIQGTVTSISIIPEPASVVMVILGGVALLRRRAMTG